MQYQRHAFALASLFLSITLIFIPLILSERVISNLPPSTGPLLSVANVTNTTTIKTVAEIVRKACSMDLEERPNELQIIDQASRFLVSESAFAHLIQDIYGHRYKVVSIIGSQSSGKSTMLNLLFGTNFTTKDDTQDKMTRGIWFGRSESSFGDPILVVDAEGIDGAENAEDGYLDNEIEGRSTLFSLAISQVVIIRLLAAVANNFGAANMPLFSNIFRIYLSLYKGTGRPQRLVLLFAFKDCSDAKAHSPSRLKEYVTRSLKGAWDKIPKSKGHLGMEKYFDVQYSFTYNPDFEKGLTLLERPRFMSDMRALKARFYNKTAPDYLFDGSMQSVDIHLFYTHITTLWAKIMEEETVNLPDHMDVMAGLKCDELLAQATFDYSTELQRYPNLLMQTADVFRAVIQERFDSKMKYFDATTEAYSKPVIVRRRVIVEEQLLTIAFDYFKKFIVLQKEQILSTFNDLADSASKVSLYQGPKLSQALFAVFQNSTELIANYSKLVKTVSLCPAWDASEYVTNLRNEVTNKASQAASTLRITYLNAYHDHVRRTVSRIMDAELSKLSVVLPMPKVFTLAANISKEVESEVQRRVVSHTVSLKMTGPAAEMVNSHLVRIEGESTRLFNSAFSSLIRESLAMEKLKERLQKRFDKSMRSWKGSGSLVLASKRFQTNVELEAAVMASKNDCLSYVKNLDGLRLYCQTLSASELDGEQGCYEESSFHDNLGEFVEDYAVQIHGEYVEYLPPVFRSWTYESMIIAALSIFIIADKRRAIIGYFMIPIKSAITISLVIVLLAVFVYYMVARDSTLLLLTQFDWLSVFTGKKDGSSAFQQTIRP